MEPIIGFQTSNVMNPIEVWKSNWGKFGVFSLTQSIHRCRMGKEVPFLSPSLSLSLPIFLWNMDLCVIQSGEEIFYF